MNILGEFDFIHTDPGRFSATRSDQTNIGFLERVIQAEIAQIDTNCSGFDKSGKLTVLVVYTG